MSSLQSLTLANTIPVAAIAGLGDAATKNTGTAAGTVAAGNDSRFTDSRAPSGAASGDLTGTYPGPTIAALAVTDAKVASANKDGSSGTASMRTLGTGAAQACAGNDSRLSDSRAPSGAASGDLSGSYPGPTIAALAVTDAKVASANKDGSSGTASMRTLGTGAAQACAGNDSRLSDSRAPSGSAGGALAGTYPNPSLAVPVWDTVVLVSGSDATTTGQVLTNITGLTFSAAINSTYEFEALLDVATTAVTTGTKYGVNVTVTPTRIYATFNGPTTVASNLQTMQDSGTNANAIASAAFLTTASETGLIVVKGLFVTAAGAGPVFSLQHLKVTSGTSTVKVGSVLKIRKLA